MPPSSAMPDLKDKTMAQAYQALQATGWVSGIYNTPPRLIVYYPDLASAKKKVYTGQDWLQGNTVSSGENHQSPPPNAPSSTDFQDVSVVATHGWMDSKPEGSKTEVKPTATQPKPKEAGA